MSSSGPEGWSRKRTCHTAASASPTTSTRFGNAGVEKNSRTASRYAAPATASGTRNDGAPKLLKLREQIVSATSIVAPSRYTLHVGLIFAREIFTVLPYAPAIVQPPHFPSS